MTPYWTTQSPPCFSLLCAGVINLNCLFYFINNYKKILKKTSKISEEDNMEDIEEEISIELLLLLLLEERGEKISRRINSIIGTNNGELWAEEDGGVSVRRVSYGV